nr:MAG TPA: hypothetical protein [Bacteriophage sp.]
MNNFKMWRKLRSEDSRYTPSNKIFMNDESGESVLCGPTGYQISLEPPFTDHRKWFNEYVDISGRVYYDEVK